AQIGDVRRNRLPARWALRRPRGSIPQLQRPTPWWTAHAMESKMTASVEKHSPEMSGLLAASSGFALVEAAFIPVSLRLRPAALWFIAVISLGALATAAGVTLAGDFPAMAAIAELPATAEAMPAVPASSMAERPAAMKNLSVEPVVLRGHPPSRAGHRS